MFWDEPGFWDELDKWRQTLLGSQDTHEQDAAFWNTRWQTTGASQASHLQDQAADYSADESFFGQVGRGAQNFFFGQVPSAMKKAASFFEHPERAAMTPEQIAWEHEGLFTPPQQGEVPFFKFAQQAVSGAWQKPTGEEHMAARLRDAPVVGGLVRSGETLMNLWQAVWEGIAVPAFGSMLRGGEAEQNRLAAFMQRAYGEPGVAPAVIRDSDSIPNDALKALYDPSTYELTREAFYRQRFPVQMLAIAFDPTTYMGGLIGKVRMLGASSDLKAAIRVAEGAGDMRAVENLARLGAQSKAVARDGWEEAMLIRSSLPAMNHDPRTVQQVLSQTMEAAKTGVKPAVLEEMGLTPATLKENILSKINLLMPTHQAQRAAMGENVGDLMNHVLASCTDPDQFVGRFADVLTGKAAIADLAYLQESTLAKQARAVWRVILAPEGQNPLKYVGEPDMGVLERLYDTAKAATRTAAKLPADAPLDTPELVKELTYKVMGTFHNRVDQALKLIIPDVPLNPYQRGMLAFKDFASKYMYMGYSLGYVVRNLISNTVPMIIDGTWSFERASGVLKYIEDFGAMPGAFRGIGAADIGGRSIEWARRTLWEATKEGGLKGGPMLRLGQAIEIAASYRIYKNAASRVYNKLWAQAAVRPAMPEALRAALGAETAAEFESAIGAAYSRAHLDRTLEELRGVAGIRMTRTQGPREIMDQAGQIDSLLRGRLQKILDATVSGDPATAQAAFRREVAQFKWQLRADLAKAEAAAASEEGIQIAADAMASGLPQKEANEIKQVMDHAVLVRRRLVDEPLSALIRKADALENPTMGQAKSLIASQSKVRELESLGMLRRDRVLGRQINESRLTELAAKWGVDISADPVEAAQPLMHKGTEDVGYRWNEFRKFSIEVWDEETKEGQKIVKAAQDAIFPIGRPPENVTDRMVAELRLRGYSEEQIVGMSVDDAVAAIAQPRPGVEAKPVQAAAAAVPKAPRTGNIVRAVGITDPSQSWEFRYRVVNLDDLVASHDPWTLKPNAAYDQTLQQRLRREAVAGEEQINRIAQQPSIDAFLTDAGQLDRGPMIVGPDMMVESGNGRTMALERMRRNNPQGWAEYQDQLRARLADYGLSENDLQGVASPVLVRERVTPLQGAARADFAAEANARVGMAMSPFETAVSDARLLTNDLVSRLTVTESQSIDQALRSGTNADVVASFLSVIPENERAGLMAADGTLNVVGLMRLRNALLAKVFGEKSGRVLAETMAESLDDTVRGVQGAIYGSLGRLAKSEALVSSGARDAELSIGEDLAKAVNVLARLRQERIPVQQYLAQRQIFERELTPVQETILAYLGENGRSSKRVSGFLNAYADAVEAAPPPQQMALFEGVGRPTKEGIINGILGKEAKQLAAERPLLAAEPGVAAAQAGAPAEAAAAPQAGARLAGAAEGVAPPPAAAPAAQAAAEALQPVSVPAGPVGNIVADGAAEKQYEIMKALLTDFQKWVIAHWDDTEKAADAATLQMARDYVYKQVLPAMNQAKIVAGRYGVVMRDFALHNYAQRNNLDTLLAYVYPYHFWYSRTIARWMERAARNPALITAYIEYRQAVNDLNKDLPLSWRNQVPINFWEDNPLFVNLEALFNPLYTSMYSTLYNFERAKTPEQLAAMTPEERAAAKREAAARTGMQGLNGWGPTIYAPLVMAMSSTGALGDPNDWIGYQTAWTRPLKAVTALLRQGGVLKDIIPPGGINIEQAPRQAVSAAMYRGTLSPEEKYEPSRVAKYMMTMYERGELVNPETGQLATKDEVTKAMNLQSGPLWDVAKQAQGVSAAVPALTGLLVGGTARLHDVDELALMAARDEYYNKIKPLKTADADLYKQRINEFKTKYPWFFALSSTYYPQTKDELLANYEKSRTWTVLLERLPPGYRKTLSAESLKGVDAFFAADGAWEELSTVDQKRLSALMDELEKKYPEVSAEVKDEWNTAKAQIKEYMAFPKGSQERRDYWAAHPLLAKYYGGQATTAAGVTRATYVPYAKRNRGELVRKYTGPRAARGGRSFFPGAYQKPPRVGTPPKGFFHVG